MNKYNWSYYDIEDRLKLLHQIDTTKLNAKELEMLDKTILYSEESLEEELNGEFYDDYLGMVELYSMLKVRLECYEFAFPMIKNFFRLTKKYTYDIPMPRTNSLSKNDLLTLCHDFYKFIGGDFYKTFLKNYKSHHIRFSNSAIDDNAGYTLNIPYLKEAFISITRDYTLNDLITVIHEYEHTNQLQLNPKKIISNTYLYRELDTSFMELVALDYFDKLLNNDDNKRILAINHIEIIKRCEALCDAINLFETERKLNIDILDIKELKDMASDYCDIPDFFLDCTLNEAFNCLPETYVIGYIFAIELYYLYQKDPEKALYHLQKFIMTNLKDEYSYFQLLQKLGLNPNENTLNYQNEMIKIGQRLRKKS